MFKKEKYIYWFSWFFIATLFLSSFQVTVAGFQTDENSVFNLLVNIMAEEENEDSEGEAEKSVQKMESVKPKSIVFIVNGAGRSSTCVKQLTLGIGHPEISSPPPEV